MTDLLPCPFCGGKATRQDIDYDTMGAEPADQNYGGSFIECDGCGSCTAVHFDRKENLVSSWNDRHLVAAARWRAFHAAAWPQLWGIETTDPRAVDAGLDMLIAPCMPEHAAKALADEYNKKGCGAAVGGAKE